MNGHASQNIGHLLQMERRKIGISQRAVSTRSSLSQSMISQIEGGELNFTIDTLRRCARP